MSIHIILKSLKEQSMKIACEITNTSIDYIIKCENNNESEFGNQLYPYELKSSKYGHHGFKSVSASRHETIEVLHKKFNPTYSRNAMYIKGLDKKYFEPLIRFEIREKTLVAIHHKSCTESLYTSKLGGWGFMRAEAAAPELTIQEIKIKNLSSEILERMIEYFKDNQERGGLIIKVYNIDEDLSQTCRRTFYKYEGIEIIEGLYEKKKNEVKENLESSMTVEPKEEDFEIKGVKTELFPYQKAGVEFMTKAKQCLNLDEMGLGKTLQSLAAIMKLRETDPKLKCLIVCEARLASNWQDEIKKHLEGVTVHIQKDKTAPDDEFDFLIVPQSRIPDCGQGRDYGYYYKAVIIDEIHNFKDKNTKQSKNLEEKIKEIPIRFGLTGTLYVNDPSDCVNPLNLIGIMNKVFQSESQFRHAYCIKEARENPEIAKKVQVSLRSSGAVLCRMKDTAWKDAPSKTIKTTKINLSNRSEYSKTLTSFFEWYLENLKNKGFSDSDASAKIEKAMRAATLVQIGKLRQVAGKGKVTETIDFTENLLKNNPNDKALIFGIHNETIEGLKSHFNCQVIDGKTPIENRRTIIGDFNNGSTDRILILSIKCGGVGLNIQGANHVIFTEYSWTNKDHVQAMARSHRLGQTKSVMMHYMHAVQSIDDWMVNLVDSKGKFNTVATSGWLIENCPIELTKEQKEEIEKIHKIETQEETTPLEFEK